MEKAGFTTSDLCEPLVGDPACSTPERLEDTDIEANAGEAASPSQAVSPSGAQEAIDNEVGGEARAEPRVTLLIRAAKLVAPDGEFVCIIRDVSQTGISVRLFHSVPAGEEMELRMPSGGVYCVRNVWSRDHEAGFTFVSPIDVARLVNEAGEYPKRGLRVGLHFPIRITTDQGVFDATVENLSQQGARFECDTLFAIDQSLRIEGRGAGHELADIRAKVRWRRERHYGVVFEHTFALSKFATLAARLQAPNLLA
jgi:hypothetical protein